MIKRKNKHNAQGCRRDGIWYDSRAEAEYADVLALLKRAGEIRNFTPKPPGIEIVPGVKWRIDFLVTANSGEKYYVEVKGFETEGYRIKRDLYRANRKKRKLPALIIVRRYGQMKYRTIEEVA